MIVVYDMRQRPQFAADVRRKHSPELVVTRNPRYFQGPSDLERRATLVYLTQPHEAIEQAYGAAGIAVTLGESIEWPMPGEVETSSPMPAPLPEPEPADEPEAESHDAGSSPPTEGPGYSLIHEGFGRYHVIAPDGTVITERTVKREEAHRLIAELEQHRNQPRPLK